MRWRQTNNITPTSDNNEYSQLLKLIFLLKTNTDTSITTSGVSENRVYATATSIRVMVMSEKDKARMLPNRIPKNNKIDFRRLLTISEMK